MIKIGIIGCGKQAPKHISGLRKISGVELVLADSNPEYAERLADKEGLAWCQTVQALFEDSAIQAVDICTPTPTHADIICQAVEAGKDFLCEKPLAENLVQVQKIKTLCERNRCVGMIGYIYRFSPIFEQGYHLFRDASLTGESMVLGKIVSAFFRIGGRGGHQLWKHRKETGGGAINEMLVHMLDLAIWYFGRIQEAQLIRSDILRPARTIQGKEEMVNAEDFVLVRLKMDNAVEVLCQADLVTPAFTQFVEIQGENGTFMGSIQPDMPSYVFCIDGIAGYSSGKTPLISAKINLFEAQMAEFVRCVKTRELPSRNTVQDSLYLIETVERLRKENINETY